MHSPTLLCIDDLPQLLEHRRVTLESRGYAVETATNEFSAIKILATGSVAAVVLEYKQEGMDAEAVAWHIKKQFPDLPIILLSGYSEIPERALWLVDEYVMRSELLEHLAPIIERAIRPRRRESRSEKPPRSEVAAA